MLKEKPPADVAFDRYLERYSADALMRGLLDFVETPRTWSADVLTPEKSEIKARLKAELELRQVYETPTWRLLSGLHSRLKGK